MNLIRLELSFKIDDLESAMYLQNFVNLRLVNLVGNPTSQDPEYRPYVLSHLKRLKYLDPAAVQAKREHYQDELMEIEENEAKREEESKALRFTPRIWKRLTWIAGGPCSKTCSVDYIFHV